MNWYFLVFFEQACKDFHACKWPSDLANDDESIALYFDKLNDKNHDAIEEVKNSSKQILTFSHFVPRQELCPEKRMLYYPYLPKVIGSDFLERRLRDIHSNRKDGAACHVFGHTHFCWDSVVDEIRYIQAPLAYPRERKRRMNSEGWLPFCVYRDGFNPEIYPALWSDYYNKNKREPENTQLAPWVARHFAKYHKFHWPLLEFMFCIYLHLPGPIRTVLEPAFTWRRKGDIDVSPVHDFFFVSTLTIDFWASKRLPVLNVCCRNQNNVYKILQSRAAEIVTYE